MRSSGDYGLKSYTSPGSFLCGMCSLDTAAACCIHTCTRGVRNVDCDGYRGFMAHNIPAAPAMRAKSISSVGSSRTIMGNVVSNLNGLRSMSRCKRM